MRLPSIFELRKFHIFLLTYPLRPLFIPLLVFLAFFGKLEAPGIKLQKVKTVADFFTQFLLRATLGILIMMFAGVFGHVEI